MLFRWPFLQPFLHEKTSQNSHKFTFTISPTNYGFWKIMIHPFLVTKNMFCYTDGTIPCPSPTISISTLGSDENTTFAITLPNPSNAAWIANDAQVRMLQISTISEASFHYVQDEEENLLQGINSYRQSRNMAALTKNDDANCVADEIAEALEHKACSSMAGPSIIKSTQPRYADYPEIVKKCDIDINTATDGVILPVCVPKRVPTLVLTNYTQSSYASYLNISRYSGVGIGKEDDWVVMVLTTNTPAGTFSNMVAPRLASVVHVSWGLAVSMVIWLGIW